MAGVPGPAPSVWGVNGGINHRTIDGSFSGATLPTYIDPGGNHGELMVLRITGVDNDGKDKALPTAPFMIRKSIEDWAGKIEGAFPEGGSAAYALKVRDKKQAERLLDLTNLADGTKVRVTYHQYLNFSKCVVSCGQTVNMSEEQIVSYLQDQKVTVARRIKRRTGPTTFENTPTIILTVSGTQTPEFIDFGYLRVRTRPYYPSPMKCFKCWAFGHTKLKCRQDTPTCGNCSEKHVIPAEGPKCERSLFCIKCGSNEHSLASRSCPEYLKENSIQRLKVDRDIDYRAARIIFEAENGRSKSYAGVTREGFVCAHFCFRVLTNRTMTLQHR
ncbi:uncharacterized protein LOC129777570 isoform X2 [Toxorhynchites rutilus septentrionalis]|uniref:uncharacterized protein LOC129777570 isoform X2 n=1 Tax=Toxorhynchites rutilus septentrionalis TaxID=329112 RepID=UPI002478CE2B|nr:uncharacterized protein LOC129777570 isoform X2 [Toxorhynchites rutilus septentrionalis]